MVDSSEIAGMYSAELPQEQLTAVMVIAGAEACGGGTPAGDTSGSDAAASWSSAFCTFHKYFAWR